MIVQTIARVALLFLAILVISLFPFPDIEPYLMFVDDAINKLYFLNPIWDMDTFFTITKTIFLLEIIYLGWKLSKLLIGFVSSGSFNTRSNDDD